MNDLEVELHSNQGEVVQKAAKKVKWEKSYSLQKKCCQEQHDFNELVSEYLNEAAYVITKKPSIGQGQAGPQRKS